MKKSFYIILLIALVLQSCAYPIALKGDYKPSYSYNINKSSHKIWSLLVDKITEKGYVIDLIDKSTGLIICKNLNLNNNYTFENNEGNPALLEAYIVCDRPRYANGSTISDMKVNANLNIRIKMLDENTSSVSFTINNIEAKVFNVEIYLFYKAFSTGVLELELYKAVK